MKKKYAIVCSKCDEINGTIEIEEGETFPAEVDQCKGCGSRETLEPVECLEGAPLALGAIVTDYLENHPDRDAPGGSTPSQYGLPEGSIDLQDLIEHRKMNFATGNIFKACYRKGTCSHSDELRDARKIKWFNDREIARLEKEDI